MALQVLSPMPGRVANLTEVPDPMFAEAMLGPGLAIDPPRGPVTAVAPISGTIASLFPHAMGIEGEGGYSILVHLGLETVQLNGEGFTLLKAKGDSVDGGRAGDRVGSRADRGRRPAGHHARHRDPG